MRIAHVTDCYLPRPGGIERQVHNLAVRQQQAGHDVTVVTSAAGPPRSADSDVRVLRPRRLAGSKPTRVRYEWTRRGCRAVLSGDFDVVHVHASTVSPLGFLTAASAARAGAPTAVTVHSLWASAAPLYRCADAGLRWSRWPVAWSAVSSVAAAPLQRILGPSSPVTVLPNGVDPAFWQIDSLPRCPERVVVATVGRLAVRKRPGPLLRMLREARAQLPGHVRLEALVVGEGPLRRRLERFLHSSGMDGWVDLAGPATHEQLRAMYADIDFYVAPATLESFGIAALEARCAGLPVVAHAESGVSDFITDDLDGLLTADDDGMVASIVRLASSATTLARMRRHASTAPSGVGWPAVLAANEALYETARLAAGRETPRSPASAGVA
ncbi:MAG: glycosyltransferase family 4 protein [Acidimicrobiales bacterium]